MLRTLRSLRTAGVLAVIALLGGTALIVSAASGGPSVGAVLGLQSTPTSTTGQQATDEDSPTTTTAASEDEDATDDAAGATTTTTTSGAPAITAAQATPGLHGKTVSDAVHAAQASSTPNAGRGAAVSLAACTEAHNRGTLPPGALAAPGQLDHTPKDCATIGSQTAAGQTQTTTTTTTTTGQQGQGGGKPTSPPGLSR